MSDQNAQSVPPAKRSDAINAADAIDAIDVVQQIIDLCRLELDATAQRLELATEQGDTDRAAASILEIQAVSLQHGLDEIAILATEAEHAIELNADSGKGWNTVAKRLIDQCRQAPKPQSPA